MDNESRELTTFDLIKEGLALGVWGILANYINHPKIATQILDSALGLYMGSLHVYHDAETAAEQAKTLIALLEPHAKMKKTVTLDDWYEQVPAGVLMLEAQPYDE